MEEILTNFSNYILSIYYEYNKTNVKRLVNQGS